MSDWRLPLHQFQITALSGRHEHQANPEVHRMYSVDSLGPEPQFPYRPHGKSTGTPILTGLRWVPNRGTVFPEASGPREHHPAEIQAKCPLSAVCHPAKISDPGSPPTAFGGTDSANPPQIKWGRHDGIRTRRSPKPFEHLRSRPLNAANSRKLFEQKLRAVLMSQHSILRLYEAVGVGPSRFVGEVDIARHRSEKPNSAPQQNRYCRDRYFVDQSFGQKALNCRAAINISMSSGTLCERRHDFRRRLSGQRNRRRTGIGQPPHRLAEDDNPLVAVGPLRKSLHRFKRFPAHDQHVNGAEKCLIAEIFADWRSLIGLFQPINASILPGNKAIEASGNEDRAFHSCDTASSGFHRFDHSAPFDSSSAQFLHEQRKPLRTSRSKIYSTGSALLRRIGT